MPDTDPVQTKFEIDDREVKAKFDEFERRLERAESKGKKAGKSAGAFMSAAIGGAAGFVASAAANNPATNGVLDLLVSVIAASLLPVMVALLPVIEALMPILTGLSQAVAGIVNVLVDKLGADVVGGVALGAYFGGKVGGPVGAAVGGVAGGISVGTVDTLNNINTPLSEPERQSRAHGGDIVSDPNESTFFFLGPIKVPVNKERLYGPTVVA